MPRDRRRSRPAAALRLSVETLEHPAVDREAQLRQTVFFTEHPGPAPAQTLAACAASRRVGVRQDSQCRWDNEMSPTDALLVREQIAEWYGKC